MYDNSLSRGAAAARSQFGRCCHGRLLGASRWRVRATLPRPSATQLPDRRELIYKLSGINEQLELTTNTSRILTLDKNIPRVQVNNPELLAVTPLSATQVQISAKKAGVTQVNLWDEDGQIHTVDVLIYGDVRELEVALQTQFPHSSIKVYPLQRKPGAQGLRRSARPRQPDHAARRATTPRR